MEIIFHPKFKSLLRFVFSGERIYTSRDLEKFLDDYRYICLVLSEKMQHIHLLSRHLITDGRDEYYAYLKEECFLLPENWEMRSRLVYTLVDMKTTVEKIYSKYDYDFSASMEKVSEKVYLRYFFTEIPFRILEDLDRKILLECKRFEKIREGRWNKEKLPVKQIRYYGDFIRWNLDFMIEILATINMAITRYEENDE